jgi:uncharacterized membrane protein
MNTNAQTETTNEELHAMLQDLSMFHLRIVHAVIHFFLAWHWVQRTTRRFTAWMAGHG